MKRVMISAGAALVVAALFLATAAATALAGQGYATGGVAGESSGPSGGTLPFTGLDLATFVLVGLGIALSGLYLRGYTARRQT